MEDQCFAQDSDDRLVSDFHQSVPGFLLTFLILLIFSSNSFSQRKSDIGFFAGTSYYMGDINPSKHFYAPSIAIGPIYRYNFHYRSSVRLSGIYHKLRANDMDFTDPFQLARGASFSGSFVDMTAAYEFNFLPYKTANTKKNQSLYTGVGVGYHLTLSQASNSGLGGGGHFTLPFSIGYKFNVSKKLSAGVEFSSRKTFSDIKLDGCVNPDMTDGDFHLVGNNDWYTFAGAFFTYKIFNYREDCPTYD